MNSGFKADKEIYYNGIVEVQLGFNLCIDLECSFTSVSVYSYKYNKNTNGNLQFSISLDSLSTPSNLRYFKNKSFYVKVNRMTDRFRDIFICKSNTHFENILITSDHMTTNLSIQFPFRLKKLNKLDFFKYFFFIIIITEH